MDIDRRFPRMFLPEMLRRLLACASGVAFQGLFHYVEHGGFGGVWPLERIPIRSCLGAEEVETRKKIPIEWHVCLGGTSALVARLPWWHVCLLRMRCALSEMVHSATSLI